MRTVYDRVNLTKFSPLIGEFLRKPIAHHLLEMLSHIIPRSRRVMESYTAQLLRVLPGAWGIVSIWLYILIEKVVKLSRMDLGARG